MMNWNHIARQLHRQRRSKIFHVQHISTHSYPVQRFGGLSNLPTNTSTATDAYSLRQLQNGVTKVLPFGALLLLASASSFMLNTEAAEWKPTKVNAHSKQEEEEEAMENEWDSFMTHSMDPNENEEEDENEKDPQTIEDLMKNMPEEDDDTTCTICILNRQGPCRPLWRKVEWCMKQQDRIVKDKQQENDQDNSSANSPCDKYMIPWLTCVQNYRNTYTVLMNKLYQQDFIDPVQQSIMDKDRVLFDALTPESFLDLEAWEQYNKHPSHKENHNKEEDILLIEASAKINLLDIASNKTLTMAYIRDQDDKVLGFDQFRKEKEQLKQQHDGRLLHTDVAYVTFYLEPDTRSIQLFALYEQDEDKHSNNDDGDGDDDDDEEEGDEGDTQEKKQNTEETTIQSILYYSHRIDL